MATLFRFSEAAALALHAVVYMAVRSDEVVKAREIAETFCASNAHVMKVCQRLTRGGLMKAHRGTHGGFTLARSASRIRLLDVYAAIEGRVTLSSCLFRNRTCLRAHRHDCILGKKIMGFESEFLDYLKTTTVASLATVSDLGSL